MASTIVNAVDASSESLTRDLGILSHKLDELHLDSSQQTITDFLASHMEILERISRDIAALNQRTLTQTAAGISRGIVVPDAVLQSLCYPGMFERRSQIQNAHEKTCQWILQPIAGNKAPWDDFSLWLSSSHPAVGIYWVHGKIGMSYVSRTILNCPEFLRASILDLTKICSGRFSCARHVIFPLFLDTRLKFHYYRPTVSKWLRRKWQIYSHAVYWGARQTRAHVSVG